MGTVFQALILLAIIIFAITKVSPWDGSPKKLAVIAAGLATAFAGWVWAVVQVVWNGLGL